MATAGYAGRLLRVDLTRGETWDELLPEPTLRKWVGGAALAIRLPYDEVPSPGTNRPASPCRKFWTNQAFGNSKRIY